MNDLKIFFLLIIMVFLSCRQPDKRLHNDEITEEGHSATSGDSLPLQSPIVVSGLLYHRFDEDNLPSTSISARLFEDHLQYLQRNDFKTITLKKAIDLLLHSDDSGRYVMISVDDAFHSFYRVGFPLLKKYGMTATLFPNTQTVGMGDYMDWDQLQEVHEYGIEIGNHSHSHDYFLDLPAATRYRTFREDVIRAQELIHKNLAYQSETFAFPYGEYDQAMQRIIRELGFTGAAAQNSGIMSSYSGLYALPRYPMTDLYGQMDRFTEKVNMLPLPVIRMEPDSSIPLGNPPELRVYLDVHNLDIERMQCFIQGSDCIIGILERDPDVILINAESPLKSRRHLYTLTMPSRNSGQWYWFSHQWVFPGRSD